MQPHGEPIAIIGSGCRFPGESSSPAKLWELLLEPRDVLRPIDRFDTNGFYHPDGMHHGASNIKDSYLLSEDHRQFDAQFFNINSVEANSMDPSQRLLLETVYEALESAGLKMEKMRGSDTAVYVGLMCEEYSPILLRDLDALPTYFATGVARSIMSNRLSYFFDWHGPSMTIDTACSSSMVAIHQAIQLLRSGDSRTAIAAGANLILGPEAYITESKLKMLSPSSRSRMWDADADGYARGDGIAAVVLKTLRHAIEDGDHIECVIRESAVNQDGRTKGITMPSATAQTALIRQCYTKAGLDLSKKEDRPQYFEAHGTGTPAGDPIEAEAINRAFFEFQDGIPVPEETLYVGSIKTVIGHTEGTAGIAAVLKGSLALQNSVMPPNMLFNRLSPKVEPFYRNLEIITSTNKRWPTLPEGLPRRISINSFGFGGTNSHVILESYENTRMEESSKLSASLTSSIPFIFTAATQRSLLGLITSYSAYLKKHPHTNLRDLAWTLSTRRSNFSCKETFSGVTVESLHSKLDAYIELNKGTTGSNQPTLVQKSLPRVLGVFTGQGAQWAGMGRELILGSASVRKTVEDLELSLSQLPVVDRPSWSLKEELLSGTTSRIADATLSQPLCTALQIVLVDLLRSTNVHLDAVVGHSSGEIGAAYAAGYISASDAIRIAYYRGMHSVLASGDGGKHGAMMAVGTSAEDAIEVCDLPEFKDRISVAAYNSSESVTLSGDADSIQEAQMIFEEENKFARILKVNKAYHSHHMVPCSVKYIKSIQACDIQLQTPPHNASAWLSSVSEDPISTCLDELKDFYWNKNMLKPVLFSQAIEMAVAERGPFDFAIEIGPHPALKGPVIQAIKDLIGGESIPYCGLLNRGKNDIECFADALGFIWKMTSSAVVDFQSYDRRLVDGPNPSLLKNLPTYAWHYERTFWHESRLSKAFANKPGSVHSLLGTRSPDGTKEEFRWRNLLRPREIPWLHGHQLQGQTVFPAAGYVALAIEASKALAGVEPIQLIELQDLDILQAMIFNDDDTGVETLVTLTDIQQPSKYCHTASFMFYSAAGQNPDSLSLTTTGKVQIILGETSPDTLPGRGVSQPNMIDVGVDHFYSFLGGLGYGYNGPFRALSSIKRKLGAATGFVTKFASEGTTEPLIVSPAMLDAAIQSVILAFCYPGDGQLWSLHVPTSIQRITINPSLCLLKPDHEEKLIFDSIVTDNSSGVFGDVDIFTPSGDQCIIQVEGMHAVPFSKATAAQDKQLFSKMTWNLVIPSAEAAAYDGRATPEEYELAYILERVAYFYLRQIDHTILATESSRSEGPYVGFFNFATHVLALVSRGKHSYAKKAWVNDTQDQIYALSGKFPDNVDLKIMHIVGKHMPAVARGETNILEHLRENNLLDIYYSTAMGAISYTNYLARIAAQITNRYPHMKILEIGAGTGGATKSILKQLNKTYSSYTFTDISNGFFEKAQEVFEEFKDKLIFKPLDIEKNIASQGFTPQSYDIIIASFVLHATANLQKTLTNVRRLLKPGGYLLLLEVTNLSQLRTGFIFGALPGWWLGTNDGRVLSPCVSSAEWGRVLQKSGFSGADTVTPDLDHLPYPISAIVSQAVDERINFIRQPLSTKDASVRELVIIGGNTLQTSRLIDDVVGVMGDYCEEVTRITTLEMVDLEAVSSKPVVLCLADLDEPIFKAMTSETLRGLKMLFNQAGKTLWVTQGCRLGDPFANMTIGFGRSLVLEMPNVQLQFLDIAFNEIPKADVLAETLLRFTATESWSQEDTSRTLWSVEPELAYEKGQYLLPRIIPDNAKNNRYNSSRRFITEVLDPKRSPISIEHTGTSHVVVAGPDNLSLSAHAQDGDIVIEVRHSMLQSMNIMSLGYLFLVSGKDLRTGKNVVALSRTQSSIVKTPASWSLESPVSEGETLVFMLVLFIHLMGLSMISVVPDGGVVVVLEPGKFIAPVLVARAAERGIKVLYLNSVEQIEMPQPLWKTIHTNAHRHTIKASLPTSVSLFVNILGKEALAARIIQCLPPHCRLESTNTILGNESYIDPISTISVPEIMALAVKYSLSEPFEPNMAKVPIVVLNEIPNPITDFKGPSVVDWRSSITARTKVETVDSKLLFSDSKTYWLVGLTGSLGLSICEWMVRRGAKYIVLTSRNPKIEESWMEIMKAAGAIIKVFANDVTNKEDAKALYDKIQSTLPPLAGVAQGAMVLHDTLISDMSIDQLNKVLKPKVDGSRILDEILTSEGIDLDFMIFFSSGTCVTGNLGQANYGTANMFMCGLAAQRRQRGLAASVINIGVIIGVGYVTMELSQVHQDNLLKAGHMWMSEQDVHIMFAEAVISGRPDSGLSPEILTGLRIINANDDDKTIWFENPKFQHLIQQETTDIGNTGGKPRILTKSLLLEAVSHDDVSTILTDSFSFKLQSLLQLNPEAIRSIVDTSTDDLGIDSLIAVEIRSWFLKELTIDMPVLKILGGSSVGDLIEHALKILPGELIPNVVLEKELSGTSTATTNPVAKLQASELPCLPSAIVVAKHGTERSVEDSSIDMTMEAEPDTIMVSRDEKSDSNSEDSLVFIGTKDVTYSTSTSSLDDFLSGNESCGNKPTTPNGLQRVVRMSFGQSRFYFLGLYLKDPTTFNIFVSICLKGDLQVEIFEKAVARVGHHHESLRTCFFTDNDQQPMQGILSSTVLQLERKTYQNEKDLSEEMTSMKAHVFDLEHGQTMRIMLLSSSLDPQSHRIFIAYHHINMDGISLQVLISDLETAYNLQPLNPNTTQFPDYSARQRQEYENMEWQSDLDFWTKEFEDIPSPLPIFPLSRITSRQAILEYSSHQIEVRIDSVLAKKISDTCKRLKATPFHFYLATLKALLLRFSDAEDFCIGIADANRNQSTMQAIGFYLNILPLRFKTKATQTFSDAIKEARSKAYSALANSRIPFDVLLDELKIPRAASHSPLFQVFLDYRQATQETRSFGGCQLEGQEYEMGGTAYDLTLDIIDNPGGDPLVALLVQKSLYTRQDGELLLKSFLNLVEAFSENPALRLNRPPIFDPVDVELALDLGRGPEIESKWPRTLSHCVDMMMERYPDSIALKEDNCSLTYIQMARHMHTIADLLQTKSIGRHSKVAIFQDPSTDWICSLLAILRVGAVYIPLDLQSSIPRLTAIVKDCQPDAVLVHTNTAAKVHSLEAKNSLLLNISELQLSPAIIVNFADPDSTAVILYTSGSTGVPKGITLKHSSLQNEMESSARIFDITNKTVVLQQSALSFDFSMWQIFCAIANGGTLYLAPISSRGDPVEITRLIGAEGITLTGATPSEYLNWIRHGDVKLLKSSTWTAAVSGGEQVTNTLMEAFESLGRRQLRFWNIYGPTEVTISSNKIELSYTDLCLSENQSPVPVGYTTPNCSVYIIDESFKPVPIGMPGEVVIGGAGVASSYLNNNELTAQKFVPDVFSRNPKEKSTVHRTGDKGRLRSDGALIIEGRMAGDTQIKLRGLRIELRDIEAAIIRSSEGHLIEAIVSARRVRAEDPQFLIAHVVFSPGNEVENPENFLRRLCISLPLPQYMIPARMIALDRMPVNSHAKTDRLAVGTLPLPDFQKSSVNDMELTETELQLRDIWDEVLSKNGFVDAVNIDTDFFHAGGNSLLLVSLQAKIRAHFNINLSLNDLFQASTLGSMAARICIHDGIPTTQVIDWEKETQVQIDLPISRLSPKPVQSKEGKVIVLTGSTGFLGKAIVRQLLDSKAVAKVYCIAVRPSKTRSYQAQSSKMEIFKGDLALPSLGLSKEDTYTIFEEADAIIHNGADVSFLKTFHSLRRANLHSTKHLASIALQYQIPFHYISTAGVAQLAMSDSFHEISAAAYIPATDGSNGYIASKWASERYLEAINEKFSLPIWIHRPSSITGNDSPEHDIMQNLLRFSRKLKAVPQLKNFKGHLDFIPVEKVASGILLDVLADHKQPVSPTVKYRHQSGEVIIPVSEFQKSMERESGYAFRSLPLVDWIAEAKEGGMDVMVAAYFGMLEDMDGDIGFPQLVKGDRGD